MNKRKLDRQVAAATRATERILRQTYSLSEAYLRAEVLYEAFLREIETVQESGITDDELMEEARQGIQRLALSPWFRVNSLISMYLGALYAVVEKWQEWQFRDPCVDLLLSDPRLSVLRKYRHAIFHADHFDAKERIALAEDLSIVTWSQELATALRNALRDWHANTEPRLDEHLLRVGW